MPERTCIGCNEIKAKNDLIRIVKNKDGQITIDRTGRANGRGAYICNKKDSTIYDDLRGEING